MEILATWNQLNKFFFGRWLFNLMVRFLIPYTGSVRPEFIELERGYAKVRIRDRRCLRNHLQSIHAAALMNIAEASSGAAFIAGLPSNARAILTHFEIEYKKKARGTLTAECRCDVPATTTETKCQIQAFVRDEVGDVVAIGTATWFVRPAKS